MLQTKHYPLKPAGYRIVVIDQNTQVIKTEQKRAWFGVNSRPRLPVSGGRASINLLDAVTDDSDRFMSFVEGSFTGKVAAHFLRALQEEFGQKLMIVLDNAPYFMAKHLKKQAAKAGLPLDISPAVRARNEPTRTVLASSERRTGQQTLSNTPRVETYLTSKLPTLNSPKIYESLC